MIEVTKDIFWTVFKDAAPEFNLNEELFVHFIKADGFTFSMEDTDEGIKYFISLTNPEGAL